MAGAPDIGRLRRKLARTVATGVSGAILVMLLSSTGIPLEIRRRMSRASQSRGRPQCRFFALVAMPRRIRFGGLRPRNRVMASRTGSPAGAFRRRRRLGIVALNTGPFAGPERHMHPFIETQKEWLKTNVPPFRPGDTVRVNVRVKEGDKERVQAFEGICIARRGGGVSETFTVRKISNGVGVERIFPLHSPMVADIVVVRRGVVRRAKLYYLRDVVGKAARIKERKVVRTAPAK